ncbi:catalase [Pseudoroseomonas wenyumeiae]|nr:catalase [Pseudoroseomonas wenyumeiae]RMI27090.1 catalase [Pseudoroseomonas wenyumeiae]
MSRRPHYAPFREADSLPRPRQAAGPGQHAGGAADPAGGGQGGRRAGGAGDRAADRRCLRPALRRAAHLSRAAHFTGAATPVLARFSNFAAIPGLPDGHPAASPRGLAVKFLLPDGGETDIVAHSFNGFPAATPEAFLCFLRSLPDAARLEALAAAEPAVRRFLDTPKPPPASYASENYFGVTAFVFVDAAGRRRHGRYRILPQAGAAWLTPEAAAAREPGYLAAELRSRLAAGPVALRLMLQLAAPGDQTADGSHPWPEDRPLAELGALSLHRLAGAPDAARPDLRFVPTSLVAGIEPSDDPMLLARTLAYDVSAERRARP